MSLSADEAPMTLLDLDPEILLQALEQMTGPQQTRAAATCKLFAVIVDEIARTTSFMTSAVGSFASVSADLDLRLEAPPTLGVCFTVHEQTEASGCGHLSSLARRLPPHLELVGGHMAVVAGTDVTTRALVQSNTVCPHSGPRHEVGLSLGRFPEAKCRSFAVDDRTDWRVQLQSQGALDAGWKVMLVIGLHRELEDIVSELQQHNPEAAIIGGIATGSQLYRIKHQKVTVLDGGVVGLMFSGDVPLAAFVSRGARALAGRTFNFGPSDLQTIPRPSRGHSPLEAHNEVQKLTHVTADGVRQSLLAAVQETMQAERAQGGLFLGMAERAEDGFELMSVYNEMVLPAEEAMIVDSPRVAAQWESGSLRLYTFDSDSCKADLTRRLTELKAEASRKGDRLLGAVMFTCGGRTHRFFGEPAFDATAFSKIFDDVPLIGMYAGGEIGPPLLADAPPSRAFQVGNAQMHGFTAIFGLFIVPARQPRTCPLAFADADAIAAAYSELRERVETLPPPEPPPSTMRDYLPSSIAELRALPLKALKQAMGRLGLTFVPGSEKEDIVQAIAPHISGEGTGTGTGSS